MSSLNLRQRRGLAFIVAALVAGAAAFVVSVNHTREVDSRLGDQVTVYRVKQSVDAFTELTTDDVYTQEVPERWVPPGVYTDASFVGRKTVVALQADEFVDETTLIPIQEIARGEREIAILVDAETGVGGRIGRGDYVNVNVTLDEAREGEEGSLRVSTVLIRRARIVSIGSQSSRDQAEGEPRAVVPVTFALSEEDSLKLLYAESFATSIRLSKVPIDDLEQPPGGEPFTSEDVEREYSGVSS